VELRKRLLGEDHPDVAVSLHNCAELYYFKGYYSKAEPLLMQALKIFKRRLGSEHPNTVLCRTTLAILRRDFLTPQQETCPILIRKLKKAVLRRSPKASAKNKHLTKRMGKIRATADRTSPSSD
jgi:hypothetical protein